MPDTELGALLESLGFRGEAAGAAALAVLVDAKLTRPGKVRIDDAKLDGARRVLRDALAPVCGSPVCVAAAARERPGAAPLEVPAAACCICEGSEQRRGATRLGRVAARRARTRLVVVGGSPETRRQLTELVTAPVELRLVDGVGRMTADVARAHLAWADLVLIWGSTELDHKVSQHFSSAANAITVAKRGVASLLEAAAARLERGAR